MEVTGIELTFSGSKFNEVQSQLLTKVFFSSHIWEEGCSNDQETGKDGPYRYIRGVHIKTLMEYHSSANRQANLKRVILPDEDVEKHKGVVGTINRTINVLEGRWQHVSILDM